MCYQCSDAMMVNFFGMRPCLQGLEILLRHPEDNRNQIRELAQMLMDGGVLDELIQQKLDTFNIRWDELMARVRHLRIRSLLVLFVLKHNAIRNQMCPCPHIPKGHIAFES